MPLISVIVPTRERCETLGPALRTLCNQDFADCEFIVSDNASEDDTAAVVAGFSDPRIRYIRTPRRVSMTSNFNFAIEHSRGDYVISIGDDDGLTPGALTALAELIRHTGADAISWLKAVYHWPNHVLADKRNTLHVPILSGAWNVSARAALLATTWSLLRWDYLPIIYHGLVKRAVLDRLRAKTGVFLKHEIPDVYSAVAISTQIENYLYIEYPYSIHGHAATSNAAAFQRSLQSGSVPENDNVERFWREAEMAPPKEFSSKGLSLDTPGILECLYRVREVCLDGRLFIPVSAWLYRFARDARSVGEPLRSESLKVIEEFAARHRRKNLFRFLVRVFGRPLDDPPAGAAPLVVSYGRLVLRGEAFGLRTIEDAAGLTARIRFPPKSPNLLPAGLGELLRLRRAERKWTS
jgi:glycosyltransferase involved in cell wall biosynthesis